MVGFLFDQLKGSSYSLSYVFVSFDFFGNRSQEFIARDL